MVRGLVPSTQITYPADLPVSQRRQEILEAIRDNQVVVIAGATGSGKTTQIPKMCLELGRTSIAHTQPRRIAARAVAERISEELKVELGGLVGYQVRFTDKASADTKVKVMTDGILLNAMQRHRNLEPYDTIIIDEAHERSLNIDFLLGYLKQLLPKRPDLKVIVTSATIDPESFSKHFNDAPIIEVSGRTFPIEVRYRTTARDADDDSDPDEQTTASDYLDGIVNALDELKDEPDGDTLVFLSGESEIRDAQEAIEGRVTSGALGKGVEVLPLYGRLSSAEQHRVFETSKMAGLRRRIILATNVAETSLTIPNIKYVIDAGTARISRYSPRAKVQRLPIEAISKASANQRAGRAGRTSPGVVIRLYSEEDFESRPDFTDPEILRTNLASVILQAAQLGLGDIAAFPFLQSPDARGIKDGLGLLGELGAVKDPKGKTVELTKVGRDLARLPIEPRFGRMLLESKKAGLVREVMVIVAGLTIQDPRERPLAKRPQADLSHARFADPTSDFLSLLNLWNYIETQQQKLSSSAFRRLCKAEFLNYLRVREWQDLIKQLKSVAKPLDIIAEQPKVDPDGIHKCLLSGLLSQIGLKQLSDKKAADLVKKPASKTEKPAKASNEYLGSNGKKFVIFPGSTLAKKPPTAIMSAELVETSRLFARMNAAINPEWAEALAGELVKRSFSEPHWEKSQGAVVAYERVMLFGVPIVFSRRMQYSRIDAALCRDLFIRHALVHGEWDSKQQFDRANQQLLKQLEALADRARKPQFAPDDEDVFRFFNARIPEEVISTRTFEGWWRKAKHETPDLLSMTRDDLLPPEIKPPSEQDNPKEWQLGERKLKLRYRYEPGAPDDGVTVDVPVEILSQINADEFDWLVLGMRAELIAELIRGLPKNIRRNVVPAADWAAKALAALPEQPDEPLVATLAKTLRTLSGTHMTAADFNFAALPTSLRMSYRVVDEKGRTLGLGLDLDVLKEKLVPVAAGEAPKKAMVNLANKTQELASTVREKIASPADYVAEHLSKEEKLSLVAVGYKNTSSFVDDVISALINQAITARGLDANPDDIRAAVVEQSIEQSFSAAKTVEKIATSARQASKAISEIQDMSVLHVLAAEKAHVAELVSTNIVSTAGLERITRIPLYLQASKIRIEKLLENPERYRIAELELNEALALLEKAPLEKRVQIKWMIEELRISLFAQTLGTAETVSVQRIKKTISSPLA
jgi:ATP-dependent helicase HrpA